MIYQRIYDLLVEKQNQQIEEGFLTRFRTGFKNPDKPRDGRIAPFSPFGHAIRTGHLADEPGVYDGDALKRDAEKLPQYHLRKRRLAQRDDLRDKLQANYADSKAKQREIMTQGGIPVPRRLSLIPRLRRGLSSAFNFKNKQRGLA